MFSPHNGNIAHVARALPAYASTVYAYVHLHAYNALLLRSSLPMSARFSATTSQPSATCAWCLHCALASPAHTDAPRLCTVYIYIFMFTRAKMRPVAKYMPVRISPTIHVRELPVEHTELREWLCTNG